MPENRTPEWAVMESEELVSWNGSIVVAQVGRYENETAPRIAIKIYAEEEGGVDEDGYCEVRFERADLLHLLALLDKHAPPTDAP